MGAELTKAVISVVMTLTAMQVGLGGPRYPRVNSGVAQGT